MKIPKQARSDAKRLFRECLKNGVLDESAVRAAVQRVIETKPRGYLAVLEHFKRLVKLDLERRSARVESVQALSPDLQEQIRNRLAGAYGPGLNISFSQNPALIGGLRVRVGCDVYDGSIRARLDDLQNAF